ncbi:DUF6951 family protein [Neomoorella thermoacetica]|uniref:Uncharacterized protein n=1 Tax=Neomoorella thermoacetica TaxID=1525 RepID=A0A1J5JXJ1_NEOTH|nr:hypothetical protein [Moorella thermoacetica]APC08441.1 hypothetical protein MTJW_12810 [Moorella thermoacetica]OIQ09255.1 hypothetical protein MOOR_10140 [Moorella thermoacetica]
MAKVKVEAGICGFQTEIQAEAPDMFSCDLNINTTCPNIQKIAADLGTLNPLEEISFKGNSRLRELFFQYCPHAACPVLPGIIKAVEVAAGLALPGDAHIFVQK